MPIWKSDFVENRPEVTFCSWAVFEVPLNGLGQPRARYLAGWSCEDGHGQACSAAQLSDPLTGGQLQCQRGLNADAKYVWNRWNRIESVDKQGDVKREVLDVMEFARASAGAQGAGS